MARRSRRLKLHEFVADLVGAGTGVLAAELSLDPIKARDVMLQVARAVCARNAKSLVYIPEAVSLMNLTRNALIWAAYQTDGPPPSCTRKFSPARAQELAIEHDLSPQQIYNIIAEQRALELDGVQPELPGLSEK